MKLQKLIAKKKVKKKAKAKAATNRPTLGFLVNIVAVMIET